LVLIASCATLLATFPLRAAEPKDADIGTRQFAIECRIVDATKGKQQIQACPKVTLFEHQPATISNLVHRPFVVAVKPAGNDAVEPIIAVLDEGWTIDLCCHANNHGKYTLDLTIAELRIEDVQVEEINDTITVQQPRMESTKRRHFVAAQDGQRFTIPLDDRPAGKSRRWAELVVAERRPDAE
jgi:hypothetical protein